MTAELTVIVPTLNERGNITELIQRIEKTLAGVAWEVIFVDDDSTDGTVELLREISGGDKRVRCLHRIGRRGLSSACIEGLLSASSPYLAVMDADMQHDETLLAPMLEILQGGDIELVVGSRYTEGGSVGAWSRDRETMSRVATWIGKRITRTHLSDPMSGMFMLRRELFDRAVRKMSGKGFKILLDLIASAPEKIRCTELPYTFGQRHAGESKLDIVIMGEYFTLLADKIVGPVIPVRFLMFIAVGILGALLHLAVLGVLLLGSATSFVIAQSVATIVAMTVNFTANNSFTYRDKRLRDLAFVRGLVSFWIVCSIGALASVMIGSYLFERQVPWWLAGLLGAVVGAVWNFGVTSVVTWRRL